MLKMSPYFTPSTRRRSMLATSALVSVLALSACATTATAPSSTPSAANADRGSIASNDKKSDAAVREVAISSTKSQDYIAAAAYWGTLYDRDAQNAEAALNYSKALRQIGSVPQALSVMQRAQQAHPVDPAILAEYGKVLAASGHPDRANAVLIKSNALKPGDWTVLSAMGVALDQLGRYDDAQKQYEAALKIVPDNPSVLTNLGLSYAIEGRLDDAERILRKAVANPRANASARQNLALVLGLQGKFDEATRLARADLPISIADNNIDYLRDMLTQPALWKQMENLDNKTNAPDTH
jgi:Flp pilus assembly protein TadD